jgi:hypothetical protein
LGITGDIEAEATLLDEEFEQYAFDEVAELHGRSIGQWER